MKSSGVSGVLGYNAWYVVRGQQTVLCVGVSVIVAVGRCRKVISHFVVAWNGERG